MIFYKVCVKKRRHATFIHVTQKHSQKLVIKLKLFLGSNNKTSIEIVINAASVN